MNDDIDCARIFETIVLGQIKSGVVPTIPYNEDIHLTETAAIANKKSTVNALWQMIAQSNRGIIIKKRRQISICRG